MGGLAGCQPYRIAIGRVNQPWEGASCHGTSLCNPTGGASVWPQRLRVPREGEVSPDPGSAQPQAPSADVQSHYSPPPTATLPSTAQYSPV